MDDQLSRGREGEARGLLMPAVIALMVLVLLVALLHQLASAGKPAAVATPTPTLSRTPPTLPPDPLPIPPAEVFSPAGTDPADHITPTLRGVPLTRAATVQLFLGGPSLIGLGSGAGPSGRVPVRRGEEITEVVSVPSGLVVLVGQNQSAAVVPGQFGEAYFVPRRGAVRPLGAADSVVAARDGRSVYAARYGQGDDDKSDNDKSEVLQIGLSGRVLARHRVYRGLFLEADTAAGLLVQQFPANGTLPSIDLLDPGTFALRKHLTEGGSLIGAGPTRAAWTDSCEGSCHDVVVADLTTGVRHSIRARNAGVGFAVFSPDGKRVALAYYGLHRVDGSPRPSAGFVEVVDLAGGRRQLVPGVATDVKQSADLAWTPDGRWLAISVVITDKGVRRVGLWPAAGGAVQLVSTSVPGTQSGGSLVAL